MTPLVQLVLPWPVAAKGYEVRSSDGGGSTILTAEPQTLIAPKDAERRTDDPFHSNPALFLQFAALDESPEACAGFASRSGLLLRTRRAADGESFGLWRDHLQRFKRLVALWREGGPAHLLARSSPADLPSPAILHASLGWRGERPVFVIVPASLLAGLELQLALAVADGAEIRACDQCGIFFECGRGKERRSQARFCSDVCRFDFHNAHRRRAKK